MFDTILVVTDFSPDSLKAMPPALALARTFGAEVHLCHVDEEEEALSGHSSQELIDFLEHVEARRQSWLEQMANDIREQGLRCEIVRLKGWASREILEYAESQRVGLTAISALGGQGTKTVMVGSTAANVLRNADRPLLFVGARCELPDDYAVRTVFYPTDFSRISLSGAHYAAALCRELGATLELFHVMKVPTYIPGLPGEPPLVLPPNLRRQMDERFDDVMAELAREVPVEHVSFEVATGDDEAETIARAAVEKKADLVIIPRRGHGVLRGLLFGRVAENVAKLSPVPTLLFLPDEAEK